MSSYSTYLKTKNSCCTPGPQGPIGIRGPTGVFGPVGPTGETGPTGPVSQNLPTLGQFNSNNLQHIQNSNIGGFMFTNTSISEGVTVNPSFTNQIIVPTSGYYEVIYAININSVNTWSNSYDNITVGIYVNGFNQQTITTSIYGNGALSSYSYNNLPIYNSYILYLNANEYISILSTSTTSNYELCSINTSVKFL
jgi:hypothetical protein